ncbi:cytochrome c oxidase subunit II [Paenibacillus lemnae]|uniref:Cytochrome c oxidase subunit 2 n=1 Tax=Paenibacillus lemnae TaxID=1330551 RepID=A0A848MAX2_PAELE|nr:cytochrome c oxidase subunit II [Paenibacillus lemnae]NMO97310.1 cytochrome c oxidase subunit II [Paenibacillus lemnae]
MMKRWQALKRLLPLLAMFSLLLSGCGREDLSVLNPQGPVADGQLGLIKLSISIMILVVIVVFAIAAYVLVKFRRRPGQKEMPVQVEGNHKLEIIWTAIPLLLVIVLAVPTIQQVFASGEDKWKQEGVLQVEVTGHQFWWEFNYPQYDVTTAQELLMPVGREVALQLKTADVLHSFWVPSLAGKTDTNPDGTINHMSFSTEKPGTYIGKCAELCGPSHGYMEFRVKAVEADAFDRWVESTKAPAVLPEDTQLAEKFKTNCLSCHAVGDQGGFTGPNLTGIGSRETVAGILLNDSNGAKGSSPVKDNLVQWLQDPQEVKPNNTMPDPKDLGFTDEEIEQIAEYLANYKLDY